MYIKNKDIETIIKMENLIRTHKDYLFGTDNKKVTKSIDNTDITFEDYEEYTKLIENIIFQRHRLGTQRNDWNRRHKEYHRLINNKNYTKHAGNLKRCAYWTEKIEEYKDKMRKERSDKKWGTTKTTKS